MNAQVFQEPALKKAKASADKALNFQRRERMFIRRRRSNRWVSIGRVASVCARQKVQEMLVWSETHEELRRAALLFLLAYTYLLRVPSEALPAVVGTSANEAGSNAVLIKDGESLVLVLHRRKNRPRGSRLVRKCSCRQAPETCVYHVLGPVVDATPVGARLFEGITESGAGARFAFVAKKSTASKCGRRGGGAQDLARSRGH